MVTKLCTCSAEKAGWGGGGEIGVSKSSVDCEQSLTFVLSHGDQEHAGGTSGKATRNEGRSASEEKIRDCDGIFDLAICRFSCLLNCCY